MTELLPMREQIALPCPFCGGPARTPVHFNGTLETGCGGNFECPGTDVLVPIAAWNLRAAPASPEGWVMAPREPTEEMIRAGFDKYIALAAKAMKGGAVGFSRGDQDNAKIYRAMIAAAPGVVWGGDRPSQSQTCGEASADAEVFAGLNSLPVGKGES